MGMALPGIGPLIDRGRSAAANPPRESPDDGVHSTPVTPHQGLDHFGLAVKDIDAVAAEIKAKGVEFTKEPTTTRPGVRICFIGGTAWISVELLERDKKYV